MCVGGGSLGSDASGVTAYGVGTCPSSPGHNFLGSSPLKEIGEGEAGEQVTCEGHVCDGPAKVKKGLRPLFSILTFLPRFEFFFEACSILQISSSANGLKIKSLTCIHFIWCES